VAAEIENRRIKLAVEANLPLSIRPIPFSALT